MWTMSGSASAMTADISRAQKSLALPRHRLHVRHVQPLRRGFTIIELVVVIAILAILGAVIVSTTGGSSASGQSDQERINMVANELDILSRALAFFEPTKAPISFKQTVGVYPSRLSHLTDAITTAKPNSCGVNYTAGQVALWTGGYYTRELPTTGLFLATGFTLQDLLVRTPANVNTQQHGTIAIVIPGVELSDAMLLDQTVDGIPSATGATVLFTPNNSSTPVTVSYLSAIGGC